MNPSSPAETPRSMNCPSEKTIPPEASSRSSSDFQPHITSDDLSRFAEQVDQGLIWDPDSAPARFGIPEEAIKLETRGITQGTSEPPPKQHLTPKSAEFWKSQTVHKNSIAAKLREIGQTQLADALEECHSFYTVAQCTSCGSVQKFPNRCDRLYCPECQPHLSRERQKQVSWWVATLKQPKHVVLTVKNQPELTPAHVDELRRWFTNLRKRKRYANWTGGFYSLEVTNEGRGWHLHIHVLVEARWIDSSQLALDWDSVTNGNGRIVKVKDCRGDDYLKEVAKYAVKGSQLAEWKPQDILTFIEVFAAKRTFGVFGSLYGARTEFAEFIATMKAAKTRCECGSNSCRYFSEAEWTIEQSLTSDQPHAPPRPDFQQHLNLDTAAMLMPR
jgi:hypothetical protein